MVITRTKTQAEGSVKYECPERNDSLGKETKQPNLQKEERSDKSLRVVVVTKKGWVVNLINQTYFLKGLRMKKSVCLMAILGAFSVGANAAHSENIPVEFTGSVKAKTCDITVGQTGNVIDLGRVEPTKNSKGLLVPVTFGFSNCTGTGIQSIELAKGQNGGNGDNIAQGTLGTNITGVTVQLYNDRAAAKAFNSKIDYTTNGEFKGNALKVTPYFARLEVGNADAQPDTVHSGALFTVTFK